MMKLNVLLFILINLFATTLWGQESPKEMYEAENYKGLFAYGDTATGFDTTDAYYVGRGYLDDNQPEIALKWFQKVEKLGAVGAYLDFRIGLCYNEMEEYDKTIQSFRAMVEKDPKDQKTNFILAASFVTVTKLDSALKYYYLAREMEYQIGEPYFHIPLLLLERGEVEKAMDELAISAEMLKGIDSMYLPLKIMTAELQIEHRKWKDAEKTFLGVLDEFPANWEATSGLICLYHQLEEYDMGKKWMNKVIKNYQNDIYSEEVDKYPYITVGKFIWDGKDAIVLRALEPAEELIAPTYVLLLLRPEGRGYLREILTEKTIQFGDKGKKHLLCENGPEGRHYTYPVGWEVDDIPYDSFVELAKGVLSGEISAGASSYYSTEKANDAEKEKEERKSKRKKTRKK